KQVRDQFRGNRHPRLVFAILPGVTEKWNDGCDPVRAGTSGGIDHDKKFHQMLVARRRSPLNQKNITAAHVLLDSHVGLAVRKRADRGLPERKSDVFANALGQLAVGCAAEDFHFWLTRKHEGLNCRARCWLAM